MCLGISRLPRLDRLVAIVAQNWHHDRMGRRAIAFLLSISLAASCSKPIRPEESAAGALQAALGYEAADVANAVCVELKTRGSALDEIRELSNGRAAMGNWETAQPRHARPAVTPQLAQRLQQASRE